MFSTNSTPTSVLCPVARKSRSVSSNNIRHADVETSSLEARLQRLFINCDSSENKEDKATRAGFSPISTRTDAAVSSSSSNNLKPSSATAKRTPKLVLSARRKLFVNDENDDAAVAAPSSSTKNDVDGEKKASAKKVKGGSNEAKSSVGGRCKSKSVSSFSVTNWETVSVSATPLSANGVVGQKISVEQLFAEEHAVNLAAKHYVGGMCVVQSEPTMLSPVLQSLFDGGVDVAEEQRSVLDCVNRLTPSGTRNSSVRHHLRRQQSASATFGGRGPIAVPLCRPAPHGSMPGSAVNFTRRFTPPPGREVSSPIYAASKLYESPSARQLPMPPLDWITEATDAMSLRLQQSIIDEEDQEAPVDDSVVSITTKFFLPNLVEDATFAASSSSSDEEEKRSLSSTDTGAVFEMDASASTSPPPSVSASGKLLSLLNQNTAAADDKASDDCNSSSGCGASVSSASSSIDDETLPSPAAATTFVRVDPLALIAAVSAV